MVIEFICLANSYKHSGRCVAGLRTDGGGWIRPVPADGTGTLLPSHYQLAGSGEPKILDVIRLGLTKPAPRFFQPENHTMEQRRWELIARPASISHLATLAAALHRGQDLFRTTDGSVPEEFLKRSPVPSSLELVHPAEIRWQSVFHTGEMTLKGRVRFRLGNTWHDLPLTDPLYLTKLQRLKEGDHTQVEIGIASDRQILLTISLGEPYKGHCYKLVAAIVVVPPEWETHLH